jgi:hypothetical protein
MSDFQPWKLIWIKLQWKLKERNRNRLDTSLRKQNDQAKWTIRLAFCRGGKEKKEVVVKGEEEEEKKVRRKL